MTSLLNLLEEEKIVSSNLITAIERKDFYIRAGFSKNLIGEMFTEIEKLETELKTIRHNIKFYILECILDEEVNVLR